MANLAPTWATHVRHDMEDGGSAWSFLWAEVPYLGEVELRICDTCHWISATCTHGKNSWNKEETHLTCNLCGIDGT